MRERDSQILEDLQKFRCLTRNDIIDLHFSNLKNPVTCCNNVMKRLRRDGYVDVNMLQQPYIYVSKPSTIKKDSQKIPHFLGIVDAYKQMLQYEKPKLFQVEPKFSKGLMEPDILARWRKGLFFIEVQKSIYSKKVMAEKIKRYDSYFHSNNWMEEPWQTKTKRFPTLLILTDTLYDIPDTDFRIFQAPTITNFLEQITPKQPQQPSQDIKISVGSSQKYV